jgi:branched-chain amino acid transport system permease protein
MDQVVQYILDALSFGSLYALLALGIALIFGVMQLINFAHGELIMAAGFVLALVSGVPLVPLLILAIVAAVALALVMERAAFRPVRGADPATLLITSFAVSYLLQNLAMLIFGSLPRTTNVSSSLIENISIAGASISRLNAGVIIVTGLLLLGLTLFLKRTAIGTQMRAAAEDFQMARLVGVKANRVIAVAFALSGGLAGVAAIALVTQTGTVSPTMGVSAALFAFIATILGGMGSLSGAVLGAFILGALTVILQATLPLELRPYRDAFVFTAVIAMLVLRPQGLIVARSRATRV